MGDHMVAWLTPNGTGHEEIKYYNYDTDVTAVVASLTVDAFNPRVSGDRALYDYSNGSDKDTWIFDARVNRTSTTLQFPVAITNTSADEIWGKLRGNSLVYLSGGYPYWAKLAVPSVTIGSVPKAHRPPRQASSEGQAVGPGSRDRRRDPARREVRSRQVEPGHDDPHDFFRRVLVHDREEPFWQDPVPCGL